MHGANDAQKTMGIIAGALVTGGYLGMVDGHLPIPCWVESAAYTAIGLGTLTGGWRIIHTMGGKITKLQPMGGFAAETGARGRDLHRRRTSASASAPRTPSPAPSSASAPTRRLSAVRWGVAGQIVWAWVLTIPAAAAIGAALYLLIALTGAR